MNNQGINTYEFISQACNSLLTNCPKEEGDFFNAIKVTSHKIKTTTKTFLTKGKGHYNKMVAQQTFTSLQMESTQAIRSHSKKLFEQLFRNRIKNISQRMKFLLDLKQQEEQCESDSTFILFSIVEELDSEFDDLQTEMQEAKKYSKVKQFKDILNLQILNPTEELYIKEMFRVLPELKEFFSSFKYEQLIITEIQQLLTYQIIQYTTDYDFDKLVQAKKAKAANKKKNKKKKKKANKNTEQTDNTAVKGEKQKMKTQSTQCHQPADPVISYLKQLIIPKQRSSCYNQSDWMENMKTKYRQ